MIERFCNTCSHWLLMKCVVSIHVSHTHTCLTHSYMRVWHDSCVTWLIYCATSIHIDWIPWSHVTHESCPTRVYTTWLIYAWDMTERLFEKRSHWLNFNESCHTWVMSHMSHVTHESCQTRVYMTWLIHCSRSAHIDGHYHIPETLCGGFG